VAVDGTFYKARFILTLLLAVGLDANGENVILAWALVESENGDSWRWFLDHLRWSIPSFFSAVESTLVSDRDKGLKEVEARIGGGVVLAHCCHHIKENFTESSGEV
jgi:transposase-like protein